MAIQKYFYGGKHQGPFINFVAIGIILMGVIQYIKLTKKKETKATKK
jgi:hypothetical protein